MKYKILSIFFILFYTGICFAENYESTSDLRNITKDYIASHISLEPEESLDVSINTSDLPSQLAKCSKKIEIGFPREFSREKINSVELSCRGDTAWHTFIPVDVQIYTKVVVAKRPISPNEFIAESDTDYAQMNISRLYDGYFKDKAQLKGYIAGQVINSGIVLSNKNIKRPQLVHKNQVIDLIARKNSVMVMMKGIAKTDGCLNETITAYNPSSKRTLEAVVVGINKAEVIS